MGTLFKKIKKKKLNQKGFSLVELMVVVAIIGILAAIAIPNYQKFQARSKQTEARTQLSGIYAAETTFASEWNYGSANLRQIGYAIDDTENMLYNCGWAVGQEGGIANDINVTARPTAFRYRGPLAANAADINNISTFVLFPGSIADTVDDPSNGGANAVTPGSLSSPSNCAGGTSCPTSAQTVQADCTTCGGTFTAAVVAADGSLDVDNTNAGAVTFTVGCSGDIDGTTVDKWTINQAKVLINTEQGI